MSSTEWRHVSRDAKRLVQQLLVVKVEQRATADDVVASPWLVADQRAHDVHLAHFATNAKRYRLQRKFRACVAAVIAANRLRAEVGLGGARTDDVGLGGARTDEARLSDGSSKEVLHMDVSLVGTPVDAGPSTRLEKALSIASSRAPIADAAA